jgi:hypothetical protein
MKSHESLQAPLPNIDGDESAGIVTPLGDSSLRKDPHGLPSANLNCPGSIKISLFTTVRHVFLLGSRTIWNQVGDSDVSRSDMVEILLTDYVLIRLNSQEVFRGDSYEHC